MNRRQFCQRAALAPALTARAAADRPPNLLFLLSDDQRYDALGCAGNRIIRTPNLDRLASQGLRFTNHLVATSICMASRATLFTGLHARTHQVWGGTDGFRSGVWAGSYPSLLQRAGYRTGFVGKFGVDGGDLPVSSFDFWRGFKGQGRYFDAQGKHLTQTMGEQAQEFLASCRAGQPFCLQVSFKSPHAQDDHPRQFLYDPADEALYRDVEVPMPRSAAPSDFDRFPGEIRRSEGRRRWANRFSSPKLYQETAKAYYRLISGMDRAIGGILDQLQQRGLAQDTVVVFSSDNGFYLGEHGMADKWLPHEESIRVPLILSGPGIPAGRTSAAMTANLDVPATLLDLARVSPPPSMQGRSLMPLVRNQAAPFRTELFYEHRFEYNGWIPVTEALRTAQWKYARYPNCEPVFEELYHLERDPQEMSNLAASDAARLDPFRRRVAIWQAALNEWKPAERWEDPR